MRVFLSFHSPDQAVAFALKAAVFVALLPCIVILPLGIVYFSSFHAGLVDARKQSLLAQGQVIAAAISGSATVEANALTIDPEALLSLKPGETYSPFEYLDFPIDPERVAPVLRELVAATKTRARVYDSDGGLILDSRGLFGIARSELPPVIQQRNLVKKVLIGLRPWLNGNLPQYTELGPEGGKGYEDVSSALEGSSSSMVRVNSRGEEVVSAAVPIVRTKRILGALMLQTHGGEIDNLVAREQATIFKTLAYSLLTGVVTGWFAFRSLRGVIRRSNRQDI
jgi:two-component system sensor histidine kinase ChvG